jgi:hypothetical protein
MKLFLTLATILAIAAGSLHANSTRSASFYLNTPEKYENKKITLYTAFVSRRAAVEDLNGVLFSAYTMSRNGDDTSYIEVLVPKEKVESFARRYGTDFKYQNGEPRKLSMRGVLRQINDTWYLDFGGE